MGTVLIACPSCSCHAFARETRCPGCGALLRASDGSIQRTAGAVLLGLSLSVTTAACGGDVSSGGGGQGGAGGKASGMGGFQAVSAYGASVTTGMGGFQAVSAYGTSVTTSSSSGGGGGGGDAGTD